MPEHRSRPSGMFQVAFDLEAVSPTWPPFSTERIWTKKGNGPYQLILENIPFFVRGLSRGDVITAKPDHTRRELVFERVVSHCGSSTIRIVFRNRDASIRSQVLGAIRNAACDWEFSTAESHVAVDIPATANYQSLRSYLLKMRESGDIGVEEAFIAQPHEGTDP